MRREVDLLAGWLVSGWRKGEEVERKGKYVWHVILDLEVLNGLVF